MAPFSIILVGEFCVTIYKENQLFVKEYESSAVLK